MYTRQYCPYNYIQQNVSVISTATIMVRILKILKQQQQPNITDEISLIITFETLRRLVRNKNK